MTPISQDEKGALQASHLPQDRTLLSFLPYSSSESKSRKSWPPMLHQEPLNPPRDGMFTLVG